MLPHLHEIGFDPLRTKFPCHLDMKFVSQFVKNYNRNTRESFILSDDGQQQRFSINIDVVQNAYGLPMVAAPCMDLRNLS